MISGGGLLCDRPHALSRDGTLLFVCCVDTVIAFDTSTGSESYRLHHSTPVTAVCLHPEDDARLFSGCKDGLITLWDLPTAAAVQQWDAHSPVESLVAAADGGQVFVSCHWRQQQAGRLFAYDLAKGAATGGRAKVSAARRLVASASGHLLATVDRHTAMIWTAESFPHNPLVLTHTKALTCAALSCNGDVLAVGDISGRIVFWHGIADAMRMRQAGGMSDTDLRVNEAESKISQATVHWHAEPVCCLSFSPDGIYLFSGGHEGVLVVWDMSSGRRTYLPRLGSCLHHIACCAGDPSFIALSLAENVIRLVDLGNMHVRCSVRGMRCDPRASSMSYMVVQPVVGHLTLASSPATVQFFDAVCNNQVNKLQVNLCPTGRGDAAASKVPAPSHVMFSSDAKVLATVEQGYQLNGAASSIARMWYQSELSSYGRPYHLASGEGNPCSISDAVLAVALHPHGKVLALALGCGQLYFFELEEESWSLTAGPLLLPQGAAAAALAFSPDGSIIAVGARTDEPVMLVDLASRQAMAALPPVVPCAHFASDFRQLAFSSDSIELVAQWDGGIASYNLVRGTLEQVSKLAAATAVADLHSDQMAVSTQAGVYVFSCGNHHDACSPPKEGLGLLRGHQVRSAQFFGMPGSLPEGHPPSAVLVLNEMHQFAAILPAGSPLRAGQRMQQQPGLPQPQRTVSPAAAGLQRGPRSMDSCFPAKWKHLASHLLAGAIELCPEALEPLLA